MAGSSEEAGWLIERLCDRKWWNGDYFTRDSLDAIRFARKEDATKASIGLGMSTYCIVTEHLWL